MPRTLSQSRDTILVACLAALSFLPPSGWQVCVGADGHWEIEPASLAGQTCCDDERPGDTAGATADDDCSDCTDYTLSSGAAVGARSMDHGPEGAVDATCVTPATAIASTPLDLACPLGDAPSRSPHSPLRLRSTILRC